MKRKYKPTGCLKFLIFLIIFVPIAFFGAHLIRGDDWRDTLSKVGIEGDKVENSTPRSRSSSSECEALEEEIENLRLIIKNKDRRIQELESQ